MSLQPKPFERGFVVATILLMGIGNEAMGQPQKVNPQKSQQTPTSAETLAAVLWKKVSVVCPVARGSESTFVFFPAGKSPVTLRSQIVEFRGAWTKLVPIRVTEADRLTGVQSRSLAFIGGSAIRHTKGLEYGKWIWTDWMDSQRLPLPKDHNDLQHRDFWDPVAIALEQYDNRWFYSKVFSTDLVDLDSLGPVPLSCAELTGSVRPN